MNQRFSCIPAIALLSILGTYSAQAKTPVGRNFGPIYSSWSRTETSHGSDPKGSRTRQSLAAAEARLVRGSKKAILETGISEANFQKHFRLVSAIDKPGDRRVVWKYLISDYETTLNDAVGYYTSDGGDRIDVHSIKDILGSAHDIEKTIPRKQAEKIMRECIGRFTNPSVVFKALTGKASLLMIASSAGKNPSKSEEREREEKRKQESGKRASKSQTSELDAIKQEENEGGGPSYFGMVNLETGKCTKGKAVIVP